MIKNPTGKERQLTQKILNLPIIDSGERYPDISSIPDHITVRDALKIFQVGGYRLVQMIRPRIYGLCHGFALPDEHLPPLKLRVVFVMERGTCPRIFRNYKKEWVSEIARERVYIKGGFLYDTPEQLDEWVRG